MAQKRRGLGRGLQALIPETQTETPSARPTDVFFPESQDGPPAKSDKALEDGGRSEAPQGGESRRKSDDIAATLLAPSKRTRRATSKGSTSRGTARKASTASSGSQSGAAKKTASRSRRTRAGSSVSRETSEQKKTVEEAQVHLDETRAEEVSAISDVEAKEADAVKAGGEAAKTDDEKQSLVPVPGATFADLPVDVIAANPHQPRQVFDEDDISELAASIKEVGLLQPIVVRRREGGGDGDDGDAGYELIMGERRLRAAKEAGLETIPAVVRYAADDELLRDALLENLHRVQLNPLEEAAAYQQLLEDFNCTHAELSQRIARSRSQISNTLRLMKLPPLV